MINSKSSLDNCGCCNGIEWLTPEILTNDHGIISLLYRIGKHGTFKESMLRGLADSAILKELTTRENDDPTIALFDVWAVILDILAFYNERIINEGYILTSRERLSLVELARHISYIPKPGVAAGSWFSFFTEAAAGAPTEVNIPIGTRVQSIPGQDEKAQIYENIENILARTEWNQIQPKLTEKQTFVKGVNSLYLTGTNNQLQPGDRILLVGSHRLTDSESEGWDFRTITQVATNNKENYTNVIWREGLGHNDPNIYPAGDARVYVFRQRAALFGHNAPDFRNMSLEVKNSFYDDYSTIKDTDWREFEIKNPGNRIIYLDAVYPKIMPDSWIVLDKPTYTELYRILEIKADSQTDYSLSTKANKILLDTSEHLSWFPLRETIVYTQSEELQLAEAPIVKPIFGDQIELDKAQALLKVGQHLIISGEIVSWLVVSTREKIIKNGSKEEIQFEELLFFPTGSSTGIQLQTNDYLKITDPPIALSVIETKWFVQYNGTDGYVNCGPNDLIPFFEEDDLVNPTSTIQSGQSKIISEVVEIDELDPNVLNLKAPLKHVYHRPTVTINANVAQSTHGETKTEILGSGNAAIPFQKFYLKQKPLTYISSASATGIKTTLEIRVDDILWKEVPTFYNRTSDERIFIVRAEDDGTTYVQFGDGVTGARLPSGQENIKATYRIGIGLEGLLKAGQLSTLLDPQLGIRSVTNPLPAINAEDPESLENIKRNAPLTVLTMDRIVSVEDFENFASAFAGIGKAHADLLWKKEDRTLHLTVASADHGPVSDTVIENLTNAINDARHENYPVIIKSFEEILFNVKSEVKIHSDYLVDEVIASVKALLIETYSFDIRSFAQNVTPSEVIATIQSVEGVLAVDLNEIGGQDPFSRDHFRLDSNIAEWAGDDIKAAQLLLIDKENIEITITD